jgi:hypothetical protein
VERNKEGDGFVRFRLGETKEQEAVGGARLTIEIGAEFQIGPILGRSGGSITKKGPATWVGCWPFVGGQRGLSAPVSGSCFILGVIHTPQLIQFINMFAPFMIVSPILGGWHEWL